MLLAEGISLLCIQGGMFSISTRINLVSKLSGLRMRLIITITVFKKQVNLAAYSSFLI